LIALTFDDGPHPEWTPRVLDVLARAGARATFFPLSARALTHPDLVARIRAEGHAVGLHGWGHLRHTEHARAAVAADTDLALTAFDAPVRWWRLPYGMAAPWSAELAAERGLEIAGWTHDTFDWRGDSVEAMRFTPRDGEVVLLHDALGPGVRRPDCAQTVALVSELLADGHRSVTLDELATVPSAPA
jgi:peptidoglycan-N-acetylglucosamine deacetylase